MSDPTVVPPGQPTAPRRGRRVVTITAIALVGALTGAVATKALSHGFGHHHWRHGGGFHLMVAPSTRLLRRSTRRALPSTSASRSTQRPSSRRSSSPSPRVLRRTCFPCAFPLEYPAIPALSGASIPVPPTTLHAVPASPSPMHCRFCRDSMRYVHGHAACVNGACPAIIS